ncbi:MAG TPA: substrate-binding domain-containing protein [Polyangiaceae bacterium]|nr:substrate-binding domain-containing protein [Polyangiaceae bacterium]
MHQPIRLGFLVDSLLSRYQGRLLAGAIRAARRQGAQVIGFQGSFLIREGAQRSFDGSFLYELAGPSSVDGLVVVSNILASVVGTESLRAFCEDIGVPVVSVGDLPGFPEVCIESRGGLTAAISHLVTVHARRKLAFIQGNPGNPDSVQREQAFRAALAALDVPVDERLIVPGTFLESSGASAVRILFEQRGIEASALDGIVSANDQMAVGAARELRARGLRVPEDLVLIGFDDDEHARSNSPPLTTVAQPIEQVGEAAIAMLLDRLFRRVSPARVVLPAEPVFRRSCGCSRSQVVPASCALEFESLEAALAGSRSELVRLLEQVAGPSSVAAGVDAVISAVSSEREPEVAQALSAFEQAVLDGYNLGLEPLRWDDLLARVTGIVQQFSARQPGLSSELECRLARARLLTNEVAARVYSLERQYEVQRANALRILGSALACARNLSAIAPAIESGLPGLGVKYCCVCLFAEDSERTLSQVIAHYEDASSVRRELLQDTHDLWRSLPGSIPPSAQRGRDLASTFPTRQLFGVSQAPTSSALDLLIYPLVFAERALGYVVFDTPRQIERAWVLENVAGHLSSAVYSLARADELRKARALAEKASAAKSEFVAMMSHEVRTPLTAIHGHLELCLRTELLTEQVSHLTRAQASSRSLLRIVDDILDFSKIEAQRLELESEPFALEEVLEQLSGTFAEGANRKNIELVFDVHPEAPLRLVGDALRVSQVLLNLVGNALKFTERGYVVVSVKKVERDSKPCAIEFSVRDSGIGMSSPDLARIFSPFTQADSSMTRRYGGTGLGLSISKRLVELMGGELEVTSTTGLGSLFQFRLPLAPVEQPKSLAPDSLAGLRVLIAEGSQRQAVALKRILEHRTSEVRVCATGAAGLAAFRTALSDGRAFDLVLVARVLPDMDGTALIARLRRALPPTELTALIVGPSDCEFSSTDSYRQVGASATIAKPFYAQSVWRAIVRGRSRDLGTRRASVVRAAAERSLLGWSVLVAQDDAVGLELTKSLLEQWGASVTLAANGREAVERAQQRSFSLILLDLNMPEVDGCHAARAIRADTRNATSIVVALTASTRAEDQARASAAGMDAYIRTPLESAVLLAKLLEIGTTAGREAVNEDAKRLEIEELAPASPGPSRPLLDSRVALSRVNGDQATYRRLLQRFLDTHLDDARDIRRAKADGDLVRAIRIVHTLASAAANIGASQLQRAAHKLEGLLSCDGSALTDWLDELERVHEITLIAAAAALNASAPFAPISVEADAPASVLLGRARALIEDNDTAAVECVQSLRASLADHPSVREPLRRLEVSIESYDFERARLEIDVLHKALASSVYEYEHGMNRV